MVMKRIRKNSGKGVQIISSNSRRIAKNVDTASRALENQYGFVSNTAPKPSDMFAGREGMRPKEDAKAAAEATMENIRNNISASLGLQNGVLPIGFGKGATVNTRLGDGLVGAKGQRIIPKPSTAPVVLKDK